MTTARVDIVGRSVVKVSLLIDSVDELDRVETQQAYRGLLSAQDS